EKSLPTSRIDELSHADIHPILFPIDSTNQIVLFGPVVMSKGVVLCVGIKYSANSVPLDDILPILFLRCSVNQTFPSGPAVLPPGKLLAVGRPNSWRCPFVSSLPMRLAICSVNQRA